MTVTVHVVGTSRWAHGDSGTVLEAGTHVLEDPPADLLVALRDAADAGVGVSLEE